LILNCRLIGLASLALTALLAGCARDPEENWSHVATKKDREVYLDLATIKIRAGHMSAWFYYRKTPSTIFFWSTPKRYLLLEAIDCQEGRMAEMNTRVSVGSYHEPGEDSEKLQFEYVTPGSVAEAMLDSVCKNQPRRETPPTDSQ
jgi:hypothetical protein